MGVPEPISIRAPLAGCDFNLVTDCHSFFISIHTPLAGCDAGYDYDTVQDRVFQSTHPSRGATAKLDMQQAVTDTFQSTHPLRGATPPAALLSCFRSHFNPRTPCGVRPGYGTAPYSGCQYFNPRTPRGVRRQFPNGTLPTAASFQSTHPSRGATGCFRGRGSGNTHFNPRTPRGVRPASDGVKKNGSQFQSTHPSRGATKMQRHYYAIVAISIHAPLTGCDLRIFCSISSLPRFQSTHTPRGVRQP